MQQVTRHGYAHHPGDSTEKTNLVEVCEAEVSEVRRYPALQHKEAKANDTVHPTQSHNVCCVASLADGLDTCQDTAGPFPTAD